MALRINTNIPSLSAQRALSKTGEKLNKSLNRLSSGLRVTNSGDDAASVAISEKLKADIRSLRQAKRNASDGVSFIQTGEGSLGEISNMLIRLRELAMQAASDTIGERERELSNIEFQNLKKEIDRIAKSTEFNGVKLLDGSNRTFEFQIGIRNNPELDRFVFNAAEANASMNGLGIQDEDVLTKESSRRVLATVDDALVKVNGMRASLGALQSRLITTLNNLSVIDENLADAKSRMADVDIASESSELAKHTILQKAGISVLAQANAIPQAALKLVG
ncbi:MAG: flagellin [Bacteriovoracales bacterium]|nr:flagellin [Bacteriovoracales bacterium]